MGGAEITTGPIFRWARAKFGKEVVRSRHEDLRRLPMSGILRYGYEAVGAFVEKDHRGCFGSRR